MEPMVTRLIGEEVRCEWVLPDTGRLVLIDPGQFEQVILNLVINARDAMPAGGTLQVALHPATLEALRAAALDVDPGDYLEVRVSDTGTGMTPDTVEHIFEPFFTTKPSGRGTGLGLSTVFGIVRQSGDGLSQHHSAGRG